MEYEGILLDADTQEVISSETKLPLDVWEMTEDQVLAELKMRDVPRTGTADDRAFRLKVGHHC